jgi:hypothetical protein
MNKLIEYKGDLYTPEELAKKLGVSDFEIIVNDMKDSWFGHAMAKLEKLDEEE